MEYNQTSYDDLSGAYEVSLWFGDASFEKAPNHKAIVNDKGVFMAPASNRYSIVNHKDVIDTVEKELELVGIDIDKLEIITTEEQSRMRARLWFETDAEFKIPNNVREERILPGMEIWNSYDGSRSVSLAFMAWRMVCMNGMFGIGASRDKFWKPHIGQWDISGLRSWLAGYESEIEEFVGNLVNLVELPMNSLLLHDCLYGFRDDDLTTQEVEALNKKWSSLNNLPEKWKAQILDRYDTQTYMMAWTAWNAYNAITWVATHGGASPLVEERLNKAARDFIRLLK